MLVKFMLKIHQARLQQYVNRELPEVQGLENNAFSLSQYLSLFPSLFFFKYLNLMCVLYSQGKDVHYFLF